MSPVLIVIVAALLVGLLVGGSLHNFEGLRVHWWVLAFAGLALQIVPVPTIAGVPTWAIGAGMLVASYVVLLTFLGGQRDGDRAGAEPRRRRRERRDARERASDRGGGWLRRRSDGRWRQAPPDER
jgi:peptidoglycan/LPS O-acetylase OafA/YrhL